MGNSWADAQKAAYDAALRERNVDALAVALEGTTAALNIEHEIQRFMLERLGIEWTPGEPFYALVEDEIKRLRAERDNAIEAEKLVLREIGAENEQLRALLGERHLFPDYPGPGEGEVSTVDTWAEQKAWQDQWDDLDNRIQAALRD